MTRYTEQVWVVTRASRRGGKKTRGLFIVEYNRQDAMDDAEVENKLGTKGGKPYRAVPATLSWEEP